MNTKANYIKQRLSLRQPLKEALDILVQVADTIGLQKEADSSNELEKIKALFPTCTDFERDFPSICFSIATGVGKTRLMGACVAYLYLQKGIRNFFVLAPNLTIYEKLIEDFGNPSNPKYVFNGISEFVHNRPMIITGDNYSQQGSLFKDSEVRINIFNISKFNSESRGTRSGGVSMPPRIKRLAEYMGQSYWDYLSGLNDLVILMDEAHRYHADASKNAINELKPVLGIELTATPIDEKKNTFKNVVYEYSLAQALSDGKYVKIPAIATRKSFTPEGKTPEEIEIIKLEDAISIHEDTKNALEIYARTNSVPRVKPFILVVCRDITHAKDVFNYVNSNEFYNGDFKNKALQIDSSTRNEELIEKQFLSLEQLDNEIEIVIHVNMLKEGWDVTNLYTIVPLRAADAAVLVEQTIGRGLRLPYNGERTRVDKVDKLTVLAHENFEKVINTAKDPNSILNKLSYIEISDEDFNTKSTVVSSPTRIQIEISKQQEKITSLPQSKAKEQAQNALDAKQLILNALDDPEIAYQTNGLKDYDKDEVKQQVIAKAIENISTGQQSLFKEEIIAQLPQVYQATLVEVKNNTIEIPRMDLVQDEPCVLFSDFDLDVSTGFNFRIISEEIIRRGLTDNVVENIGVIQGALTRETPLNLIISSLIDFPEINYDDNADLLVKLSNQALLTLSESLDDYRQLPILVKQYRRIIAHNIYDQIKQHMHVETNDYAIPKVLPFVKIEQWHFTAVHGFGYKDYRVPITPVNTIPKYIFRGFEKACHLEYKFDSKTELDLAFVLENERNVLKWLRPAEKQFRIYWANNSKMYHPDFVVETNDSLYLIETKAANEINSDDVIAKKIAALRYCKYASDFTTSHGGKPWKYMLIPHDHVSQTSAFNYLESRFTVNQ